MEEGARAALSPNEETTLRRVDYGLAKAVDLDEADVAHLIRLRLIDRHNDKLGMTALGKQCLMAIRGTAVPVATDRQIPQLYDKILQKTRG